MDNFISVVQGGPGERRQMLRNLFHQIDWVFRPNMVADTDRKDPIYRKNMGQGDGAWYTWKTSLRWDLDTITHLLRLPLRLQEEAEATLAAIPRTAHTTSMCK